MAYYGNILEEELKNKVAHDLFVGFDTTQIIGRVDFCVSIPADPLGLNESESLLWAEAKKGTSHDIRESFIQLILTLGKERPQDTILPPAFLGAFDAGKIAFLPYSTILDVLRQNDFNWNVAPSDHTTKEFRQLKALLSDALHHGLVVYDYERDAKELAHFIRRNFALRRSAGFPARIRINKNNFTHIYLKWLDAVKPTININWATAKQAGIIDADFYLADILSKENNTLGEKLFVLLQDDHYVLDREIKDTGLEEYKRAQFSDHQQAHTRFWNRYARPPRREYWADIVARRDLLVPQDVRERKGSFFTPARWVELSQQYLAAELGENWQEEYYVWDCCAGTGNLLAGLTNKYNIYASTLDKADVQAMLQRIDAMNAAVGARAIPGQSLPTRSLSQPTDNGIVGARASQPASNVQEDIYRLGFTPSTTRGLGSPRSYAGANLLESHVFQFDFLNDPLLDETDKEGNVTRKSKLPKSLQDIIRDPEKRKKLVIYINPPYAEASNARTSSGTGTNRSKVSSSIIKTKYKTELGRAANELFAQFFCRIVKELKGVRLGMFSTLKILEGPNFRKYRETFNVLLEKLFLVPGYTFDNVSGQFPIGFQIWNTSIERLFKEIEADVYDDKANFISKKTVSSYDGHSYIIEWLRKYYDKTNRHIAYLRFLGTDFQNNSGVFLTLTPSPNDLKQVKGNWITEKNIIPMCVYFAVRKVIDHHWTLNQDQYLYPLPSWEKDEEFMGDCLVFTLFNDKNRISTVGVRASQPADGGQTDTRGLGSPRSYVNHWIPFTEEEVGAQEKFESHFMSDYLHGKFDISTTPMQQEGDLFAGVRALLGNSPRSYSSEAQAVLDAGRELWRYYHQQPIAREKPNASFYDIRLYFQGTKTTKSGKVQMNTESTDERYTALIAELRQRLKALAKKIEPKVYGYGFLKK